MTRYGECLCALAMTSAIALAEVVTPATAADVRWRRAASVSGYELYYGNRYSPYYRRPPRPYEYDHHYGLNLYGQWHGIYRRSRCRQTVEVMFCAYRMER
jgi:hypothetical protein